LADRPWRPQALGTAGGAEVALVLGSVTLQESRLSWNPCLRIIASEYAGENLFDRITEDPDEEKFLREVADLTNPHVQDQLGNIELVKPDDRIYGHGAGLIMAAFAWPGKPSRFSDGSRGTYYAADSEETAVAETRYHDELFLVGSAPIVLEKTLIHAALAATLVDIRLGSSSPPDVYNPTLYHAGQAFGDLVRRLDGYGIVYSSVRRTDGECVAIFRPTALQGAQAVRTLAYEWDGHHITRVT
jgi:hypothetical protein